MSVIANTTTHPAERHGEMIRELYGRGGDRDVSKRDERKGQKNRWMTFAQGCPTERFLHNKYHHKINFRFNEKFKMRHEIVEGDSERHTLIEDLGRLKRGTSVG